jgi:hypothetical protein
MRRFFILTFVALFLSPSTVDAAYRVSGTITDYILQAPVQSCLIQLKGLSPGTKTDSLRTDSTGNYAFTEVTSGVYILRIADKRYLTDSVLTTINDDSTFSFVTYETAHTLVTGTVPDTLSKEGNPYLVLKTVTVNRPLTIKPGVKVVFLKDAVLQLRADLKSIGTQSDSVVFTSDHKASANVNEGIFLAGSYTTSKFQYCRFYRLGAINHTIADLNEISFEHCSFIEMNSALEISKFRKVGLIDNRVINCAYGFTGTGPMLSDSIEITGNLLICKDNALYVPIDRSRALIRRNTIVGPSTIQIMQAVESDTIASNIFLSLTFENGSGKNIFFAFNDVLSLSGTAPVGIGTNVLTNINGDPCDYFYNISKKPLFSDSATGRLQETSPCINAGLDKENIGVYQGNTGVFCRESRAVPASNLKVHSVFRGTSGMELMISGNTGDYKRNEIEIAVYGLSGKRIETETFIKSINQSGTGTITIQIDKPLSAGNYFLRIKRHGQDKFVGFTVSQ